MMREICTCMHAKVHTMMATTPRSISVIARTVVQSMCMFLRTYEHGRQYSRIRTYSAAVRSAVLLHRVSHTMSFLSRTTGTWLKARNAAGMVGTHMSK